MKVHATAEPKIHVLEAEPAVRDEIVALVTPMSVAVVAYDNAEEFLAQFDSRQPGCIVSGFQLNGALNGVELLELLVDDGSKMPAVLLIRHAATPTIVRAMKNGAITVLDKPAQDDALLEAIGDAIQLDSMIREQQSQIAKLRDRFSRLTDQERTVFRLMVEGKLNKQISGLLKVSVRTVESRRQQIFKKTGAMNLSELILQAMMLYEEGCDLFQTGQLR